jgi:hypothetical protein
MRENYVLIYRFNYWWECKLKQCHYYGKLYGCSSKKKIKNAITMWSSNYTLNIHPKELNAVSPRDICIQG